MREFALIDLLTASLPTHGSVVVGAGDDCAVLDLGLADRWVLFKTDAVVEGVHFTAATEPRRIGHKALARCASDLAAMGGLPTVALVTVGLPIGFAPTDVQEVYAGLNALARRLGVGIAGGETSASPDGLWLSVALLGTVAKDRCVLRSGGRPGDALFVTGTLGGSRRGKHLDFEPRVVEGRWLAERFPLHAMIDLSDGLAGDLRHVLKASGVGAELDANAIPISEAARATASGPSPEEAALRAALTDGEDFELLFSLATEDVEPLLTAWPTKFPHLSLSHVGVLTHEPGLRLRDDRGVRPLELDGYAHFQ
jgi:thiamine-monophosphate kinase